MCGKIFFFHVVIYFLIFTSLSHPKQDLNFMFALNFGVIYIFEFLVLVEITRNDEGFIIYPQTHRYIPSKQQININTIIKMA
jgi:hypothetical protein